jgi:hypothetical protein
MQPEEAKSAVGVAFGMVLGGRAARVSIRARKAVWKTCRTCNLKIRYTFTDNQTVYSLQTN